MGCSRIKLWITVLGLVSIAVSSVCAIPQLTSSLDKRNFTCQPELAVYTCSGSGRILQWYFPPIRMQITPVVFTRTSSVGSFSFFGPSNEISIIVLSINGSDFVSALTVDSRLLNSTATIFCGVGDNGDEIEYSSSEYIISESTPTLSPNDMISDNSESDLSTGTVNFRISPPENANYDVKQYRVALFRPGTNFMFKELLVGPTDLSVVVGIDGPPGSTVDLSLAVETMCNVTGPFTARMSMSTYHSSGYLAASTVPVVSMTAVVVVLVVVLVVVVICMYTSRRPTDPNGVAIPLKADTQTNS